MKKEKEKNEFQELGLNFFKEKDGLIYVNLISNGLTGQEWIDKFEIEGRNLPSEVKMILTSKAFIPTSGVVYKLVIILGKNFLYGERTVSAVREFAYQKGFYKARLEVTCLLRDLLSDDDLRERFLRTIVVVSTHAGKKFTHVLDFDTYNSPNSLGAHCVKDIFRWQRSTGFVFSTSKIKSKP